MADNITIDLGTVDKRIIRKLQSIGLGDDIAKKLEIHELTDQKTELQKQLNVINERLVELRK